MGVNHDAKGSEHYMNRALVGDSTTLFGVDEGSRLYAYLSVVTTAHQIENV